ncbi:phage tail tape measure C-terminal domain-containing protein [Sulfurimonas sp. HSL-1716]|uniref:phage tail tape measure C-terminal domain-containing protein n=1 Tax=Hydrocurvibacter sulfurireducens TaxID=3131937 RepID=UPI0031F820EC
MGKGTVATLLFDVKSDTTKLVSGMDRAEASVKKAISNMKRNVLSLASAYVSVTTAQKVMAEGLNYNKDIENAKAGLNALTVATSQNIDSTGKMLSVTDKYRLANIENISILKDLQTINAQTPHTLTQTIAIYKTMYPSMKAAGASTKDMIDLTKMVSIAAGSAGVQFNELLAGVDGLATGTVLANSDLGRFLKSIGLSNDKLKNTSDVVGLVKSRLEQFEVPDTWSVSVSNLENSWDQLDGKITEDSFNGAKKGMNELSKLMNDMSDDDIHKLTIGIDTFGVVALDVVYGVSEAVVGLTNGFESLGARIAGAAFRVQHGFILSDSESKALEKMYADTKKNIKAREDFLAIIEKSKNVVEDSLQKSISQPTPSKPKNTSTDNKKHPAMLVPTKHSNITQDQLVGSLKQVSPSVTEEYQIQIGINKALRDRSIIGKDYGAVQNDILAKAHILADTVDKQNLDVKKTVELKAEESKIENLIVTAKKNGIDHRKLDDALSKNLKEQAQARLEKEQDVNDVLKARYDYEQASILKTGSAFEGMKKGYDDYVKNLPTDFQNGQKVMQDALSGTTDAFVQFAKTGKLSFDDLADTIISDILRMAIEKQITAPLFGSMFGSGGFLGTAFENGGIMTSSGPVPLKAYANGGIANSPQLTLFGEGRMPEAYVPLPDGRSIPVSMKGGGGSNVVINIENKSGQSISADKISEMTRTNARGEQEKVISIVLDGVARNVNGIRDALKGIR